MTCASDHSVQLLLEGIAEEIMAVTELLLDVEARAGLHEVTGGKHCAQQFDLSLQILNDLARLARRIGEGVSGARIPSTLVREGDLLLERTRNRLLLLGESPPASPVQPVELF
jgi:hypothetical protein